jgi:hypothetical protein
MSDQTEIVECDVHGASHATFVCQHLARSSGLGFFCYPKPDDPRPDAWCADCNAVILADGRWNETNEKSAGITLLCASCYDEAKRRNQR